MESQTSALPLGYARHRKQFLSLYNFDFVIVKFPPAIGGVLNDTQSPTVT